MKTTIQESLQAHLRLIEKMKSQINEVQTIAEVCNDALKSGKKILWAGNGGSASDSQHLAAELVGRFEKNREAIASVALTTDTSILTAVGNDYGFDSIFSRQIEALGKDGDVLIAISTSGNSPNIIRAVEAARLRGLSIIGFLGKTGGELKELVDHPLVVPSENTARIQEAHILIGHILCQLIEESLCP